MKIGDKVKKIKGYSWPGVIVADFTNLNGDRRLVVECTVDEVKGALHIYSPEQLAVVEPEKKAYVVTNFSRYSFITAKKLYELLPAVLPVYDFSYIDDDGQRLHSYFNKEPAFWTRVEI